MTRSSHARIALALSAAAAIIAGGCSSSCNDEAPVARTSAERPDPTSDPDAESQENFGTDGMIDVASGEALVHVENGRVRLVSNQYPQIGLLGKLSREAGFEQARTEERGRSANVTVRLMDVTVEEAIAAVLTGLRFQIHYGYDAERKRTVLTKVSLGGDRQRMAKNEQRRDRGKDKERGRKGRRRNQGRDRGQTEDDMRVAAELAAKRGGEIEIGLTSGDPETRGDAVDRLRPEGEELEVLKDLLINDANPEVRRIAAGRLEAGGGGSAVNALVTALNDPDREVVLAVIDALEFTADAEHISMIEAAGGLRSSDPEVQDAYDDMLDFLE